MDRLTRCHDSGTEGFGTKVNQATPSGTSAWATTRSWRLPLLGAIIVILGAAAACSAGSEAALSTEAGGGVAPPTTAFVAGPCPAPEPNPSDPALAAEERRVSIAAAEEAQRTGWDRFRTGDAFGSGYVCGWVRNLQALITAGENPEAAHGGMPVHDGPEGAVIGYSFQGLGFIAAETADSPGFDAASLRVARYGCDPIADAACKIRMNSDPGRP